MDPVTRLLMQGAAGANSNSIPWDLSNAAYNGSPINFFSTYAEDTNPFNLFLKPDGTKLYLVARANTQIIEYNLTTAWDITTASYSQGFTIGSLEPALTGVFFKDDGTKMYIIGTTNDTVREWTLTTAWDISTIDLLSRQDFSVAAQDNVPNSVFFKGDGTKMYITGDANDSVFEYTLSTAWDISTASYNQSKSVAAQETQPEGVSFKNDGTKMYIAGNSSNGVLEYDLSTAWDISTATYSQLGSTSPLAVTPRGLFFKSDGSRVFVVDNVKRMMFQYSLSTAWDISTISFGYPTTNFFQTLTSIRNLFLKSDGSTLYVVEATNDYVTEYSLSSSWNIATASLVQSYNIGSQATNPGGLFFKDDGSKMYVTDLNNDSVYEYDLSTAWDISTASYLQSFSVASQDSTPNGLSFKDDGTKMYFIGGSNDAIFEYALSTAWDISTASYTQNLSVSARDTGPNGLYFRDDGLKLYFSGVVNDSIYEYDLSTAWDISTASYLQSFSVASQMNTPRGIFFKSNGTKLYIAETDFLGVWSYDL